MKLMTTTLTGMIFLLCALGSAASASPLNKEAIRYAIRKQRDALNGCYRKGLEKNPRLQGKVVVAFTIKARGIVKDASIVQSTLNNRSVETCIVGEINKLHFPRHSGDVTIRYPFRFQPLDKSAAVY